MSDAPDVSWGEGCNRDGCDHPTPWDMIAVIVNGWPPFCSPQCAREAVAESDIEPAVITIHDPQYRIDRDAIDNFPRGAVGRRFQVGDVSPDTVFDFIEMHGPNEFRVTADA